MRTKLPSTVTIKTDWTPSKKKGLWILLIPAIIFFVAIFAAAHIIVGWSAHFIAR